jgi:two-component system, OmpR family, sensor kinase
VRTWRGLFPLVAAVVGLCGSLAATLLLHQAASSALDRLLDERLRGAGESAALLMTGVAPSEEALRALMTANALDGAYAVDRSRTLLADASGAKGRVDLLRVDPQRLERAFQGEASVAPTYSIGELTVASGYFPMRASGGEVRAVLGLEAGLMFIEARRTLSRALAVGLVLSLVCALALAVVAVRWSAAEQARLQAAERAVQIETLRKMAAMAAHEIRNPLSIISGTVELMRERSKAALGERDRGSLESILGEVDRLRQLTDDFLDLSAARPLSLREVQLADLLEEVARATEAAFPGIQVRCEVNALPPVSADRGRLRQVFANLLTNAAQAQQTGELCVRANAQGGAVCVDVEDRGPGISPEVQARLFDPFVTTKARGTGLGLAISRQLVIRHGGNLSLVEGGPPGTTFRVQLPRAEV